MADQAFQTDGAVQTLAPGSITGTGTTGCIQLSDSSSVDEATYADGEINPSGEDLVVCVFSSLDCSLDFNGGLWYNYMDYSGQGVQEQVSIENGNDLLPIYAYSVEKQQSDGGQCGCVDTDTFDACI